MLSATNFAWRFKDYFPFYRMPSVQFKLSLRALITQLQQKKNLFILFYLYILLFFRQKSLDISCESSANEMSSLISLISLFFLNK